MSMWDLCQKAESAQLVVGIFFKQLYIVALQED